MQNETTATNNFLIWSL